MKRFTRFTACLLLALCAIFTFSGATYADISAEDKEKLLFYKNYTEMYDIADEIYKNSVMYLNHVVVYSMLTWGDDSNLDYMESIIDREYKNIGDLLEKYDDLNPVLNKQAIDYGYDPSPITHTIGDIRYNLLLAGQEYSGVYMKSSWRRADVANTGKDMTERLNGINKHIIDFYIGKVRADSDYKKYLEQL